MAFPYSAGDVLTAADLNQSSGLVFVKSQTIGSGVSSVTVTDVFSSTFKNYRIFWDIEGGSTTAFTILFTLGSTTTGYYWSRTLTSFSTGSVSGANGSNVANWQLGAVRGSAGNGAQGNIDLMSPHEARQPMFTGSNIYRFSGGYADRTGGFLDDSTTQYTSFTMAPSGGTMTGGVIKVYGYNNG